MEAEGQKRRAESRRRARAEAQAQVKAEQDRIAQFWDDLTPAEQDWIRSEAIASADKFLHSRARVARFGVATAWTATRLSTAALSDPRPSRLDPRAKRPRVNTGREKQYPREDARLRRSDRRKQPAREAMAAVPFWLMVRRAPADISWQVVRRAPVVPKPRGAPCTGTIREDERGRRHTAEPERGSGQDHYGH